MYRVMACNAAFVTNPDRQPPHNTQAVILRMNGPLLVKRHTFLCTVLLIYTTTDPKSSFVLGLNRYSLGLIHIIPDKSSTIQVMESDAS
jgi:hypothetical protein